MLFPYSVRLGKGANPCSVLLPWLSSKHTPQTYTRVTGNLEGMGDTMVLEVELPVTDKSVE